MDFDDPSWSSLKGGYRVPYDPRQALRALEQGGDVAGAWNELWNELHHQGDVGEASYATVPHLVRIHEARGVPDWNTYGLVATIEDTRHSPDNPSIPPDLQEAYDAAWGRLVQLGLVELRDAEDPTLVCCIIAVIAMGKGQLSIGRFAVSLTEDERQEILAKEGWS
jgi:hypothetical protein